MAPLKIFFVLALAPCVFSGPLLKKKCEVLDGACSIDILQTFFKEHGGGCDDHKLITLDPATIPSVAYYNEDLNFTTKVDNVKVTGFKDVAVTDIVMDSNRGPTAYKLKFDFVAEGDMTFILKSGKTIKSPIKYTGALEGAVKFADFTTKSENGVVKYTLGPETITCHGSNIKITTNEETDKLIAEDPECKALLPAYEKQGDKYLSDEACVVAGPVFKSAIENVKYAASLGL